MLTENQITELLAEWFCLQGCEILNHITTKDKGIDLVVLRSDGKPHNIEVKGETSSKEDSKRFGLAFSGNQIWNHVSVAFMKTIYDMDRHKDQDATTSWPGSVSHSPLVSVKPTGLSNAYL